VEWKSGGNFKKFHCRPKHALEFEFFNFRFSHKICVMTCHVGPAVFFSESPTVLQYPPPTLGQHTFEILQQQLHYDDSRIKELEQSKVIQ